MKRHFGIAALILALSIPVAASAQSGASFAHAGKLGLGVGGGVLTNGLSGKFYLSDMLAAQAVLGLWYGFGASASVDVILEMPKIYDIEPFSANWNVGVGGSAVLGSGIIVGAQGVVGVAAQLKQFPVEIVAELRPTLLLGSNVWSGFYFGGGGHVRYYF